MVMLWANVYKCLLSDKCRIFSVSCGIFIVKQLGKYDFSCDFLLPDKYEKQEMLFSSD